MFLSLVYFIYRDRINWPTCNYQTFQTFSVKQVKLIMYIYSFYVTFNYVWHSLPG